MASLTRPWTQTDDEYLKNNYLTTTHEDMARELGRTGPSVRNRCWRLGLQKKVAKYPDEVRERIRAKYAEHEGKPINLYKLSEELGLPRGTIATLASKMGIAEMSRPLDARTYDAVMEGRDRMFRERGHPRGMLGKTHTAEVRQRVSEASTARWEAMSEEERADFIMRCLKARRRKGTLVQPRPHTTWKQGWHTIGGKRHYFRSKWEVNYAHYLEWLKQRGEIKEWEYEPTTFWFEAIKRGTRSYTPDFRVTEKSGAVAYHEVKGWMDDRSKTKLKRMKKYHPDVTVVLVDSAAYRALTRQVGMLVPGWK